MTKHDTDERKQWKVDAILKGDMAPEECCSYGVCKGGVVVAVGV